MNKALVAAVLLVALSACGSVGTDPSAKPASKGGAGKTLPFAPPPPAISEAEGLACAADVKQCPDGSTVSRNPAQDCAFNACPGAGKP